MRISKLSKETGEIIVAIPLTMQSGKARVKVRNSFYEYGQPTATRQIPFSQKHYVEWQIGYDVDKGDKDKLILSTLQNTSFVGANGKDKALYELSEYIYYFTQWEIITRDEIVALAKFLRRIEAEEFIDFRPELSILRSHPKTKSILGIEFYHSQVQYPLLVYKFGFFDVLIEIVIKEKQRVVGVQPMLYVCCPITELRSGGAQLLGRTAESKECAYLVLGSQHKYFLLETIKIFGILSKSHNHDVLEILNITSKI